MKERLLARLSTYLLMVKDEELLLLRRQNSGFADDFLSLPAGHIEAGESIKDATVREAFEETGVVIDPEDLEFIHVVYHHSDHPYIDFYWLCTKWTGQIENKEPEKCSELSFHPLDELPGEQIAPNVLSALEIMSQGDVFSEFDETLSEE